MVEITEVSNASLSYPDQNMDQEGAERLMVLSKLDLGDRIPFFHVTKLDLPNAGLSELPRGFAEAFPNLSIIFLPQNNFREMPAVIGTCKKLQMVAFKDNQLESIHPEALQAQLRWLILTNNRLREIPDTIGRCRLLQKCMLSGNRVRRLPPTISMCRNLELVRLASNDLHEAPMELLRLPSLRWVALSDNPFIRGVDHSIDELPVLEDVPDSEGEILGQGAGGVTRKVRRKDATWVAVKEFGGNMTSDGLPAQERHISCAASQLQCEGLVQVLGETQNGSLVMEYLENFMALAGPPSLDTCSRDVYRQDNGVVYTHEQVERVISTLLQALVQLHSVGITHGDFYAHNILVSAQDPSDVRLSDFGAAFFYDKAADYGQRLEQIELRAFAVLIKECTQLVLDPHPFLKAFADYCTKEAATLEEVRVWWRQKQLARMARAFAVDHEQ